jgi:hypothetical protein
MFDISPPKMLRKHLGMWVISAMLSICEGKIENYYTNTILLKLGIAEI